MKIQSLLILPLLSLAALTANSQAHASTIKIACGESAYEALDENKPNLADVYVEAKLRGPNNPPTNVSVTTSTVSDLSDADSAVTYKVGDDGSKSLTVARKRAPYDSVEVSVKNCQDLDSATGTGVVKKYVGGFAGTSQTRYTCSCKTE